MGFTRGTPNDFACCGWVCAHAPGWWQHHGVPCDCPINRALGEINGSGYRAAVLSLLQGASWGKEGAGCLGNASLDREVAPQGTIQSLKLLPAPKPQHLPVPSQPVPVLQHPDTPARPPHWGHPCLEAAAFQAGNSPFHCQNEFHSYLIAVRDNTLNISARSGRGSCNSKGETSLLWALSQHSPSLTASQVTHKLRELLVSCRSVARNALPLI